VCCEILCQLILYVRDNSHHYAVCAICAIYPRAKSTLLQHEFVTSGDKSGAILGIQCSWGRRGSLRSSNQSRATGAGLIEVESAKVGRHLTSNPT
jgi:hypothetical protein